MKQTQYLIFSLLFLIAFTTGCAKGTKRDVKVLQAQVGQITDEIVRLDEALYDTRAALQEEQNRLNSLQSETGSSKSRIANLRQEEEILTGIYRTPSGFELPSAQIQQALKNAGYYRGNLDGKIGPQTRAAVEAFQSDQGLTVDGIVGRNTWSKLKAYLNPIK